MADIRSYLLSVTASAVICGILVRLMGKKGLMTETVKLLAGVYMTITVLNPWVSIRFDSIESITGNITANAESVSQGGINYSRDAISEIITERTRTYILDKATSLGAAVTVEVVLTGDTVPYPSAVTVTGRVSPYTKSVLAAYITDTFGISMEDQTWIA